MARLPCFVFLGQSNMDGAGSFVLLDISHWTRWTGKTTLSFATFPIDVPCPGVHYWTHRMPNGTAFPGTATSVTTTTITQTGAGWTPGAFVNKWVVITDGTSGGQARLVIANTADTLTLERPVVGLSGTPTFHVYLNGSHDQATYEGSFRVLNFHYEDPGVVSPVYVYTTGYEYPNHKTPPLFSPAAYSTNATVGPSVETSWQLANDLGQDVWIIQLSIGSAYMSRFLGALPNPRMSWYDPAIHNDWHPNSTNVLTGTAVHDLFDMLVETIIKTHATAWLAANRPGDTLDCQGVFVQQGEVDSITQDRAEIAGTNMALIRDVFRQRIRDAGLTTLARHRIPWILGGHREATWPMAGSFVNPAFKKLAANDPYTGYVDTNDLATNIGDTAHFSANSLVELGRRHAMEWRRIRSREISASTADAARPTLDELRTRVRRRYESNTATNLAFNAKVDQAINDAQRQVYLELGDTAWFLQVIEKVLIEGAAGSMIVAPKPGRRLLKIERDGSPGEPIPWHAIGTTESGSLQIVIEGGYGTGDYLFHYRFLMHDLETDQDRTLLPGEYCELLIVLACLRMSETAGNSRHSDVWSGQAERLWKYVKRDVLNYGSQMKGRLRAKNFELRNRFTYPWERQVWVP